MVYILGALIALSLVGLAAYGYVMNIITILHSNAFTAGLIVRVIGIFLAPIGAIAGYF